MKLLTLLAFILISAQAFAGNVCRYEMTDEFQDAVKQGVFRKVHATNPEVQRYNKLQREMIFDLMQTRSWWGVSTMEQALREFGDFGRERGGRPGSLAGHIEFYRTRRGTDIAYVVFWPGDNEYGAFYELKDNKTSFRRLATVGDGEIVCERR